MRLTAQSTVIDGHRIEAGTRIVPQISTFLYDEKVRLTEVITPSPEVLEVLTSFLRTDILQVFPNPTVFDPSRFLDEQNNVIQ